MIQSYDTMPVGIYGRLIAILQEYAEDDPSRNIPIIALLTGHTEQEIMTMPLAEFADLRDRCNFLLEEPRERSVARRYTIGSRTYAVVRDERDLTAGQFIDYQAYAKDLNAYAVEMLSVLLVPVGYKYNDGYDIREVQEEIREHLPITEALALINFSLRWSAKSSGSIQRSLVSAQKTIRKTRLLTKQEKTRTLRVLTLLRRGGVGLLTPTLSLRLPTTLGTSSCRIQSSNI